MNKLKFLFILIIYISMIGCKDDSKSEIQSESLDGPYVSSMDTYRYDLMERRKGGYLQLVGLMKMDKDIMKFGKDSSNYLSLNIKSIPEVLGTFSKKDSMMNFSAENNVEIKTKNDSIITNLNLDVDDFGNSLMMYHKNLKWQIITRNNQPYLRVWDSENPEIDAFNGFELYPLNPDMLFEGDFSYFEQAKKEQVRSQLGPKATTEFIGQISFTYNNERHSLDVGKNGFTMVADKTTGNETYGGGRYMYLELPEKNGKVVLDFNKLYNPPCSFSEFTTCNYPPQQNDLTFKVEAGEKIAKSLK